MSEMHIQIRKAQYPGTREPVLHDVDITIPDRTFTAVIGRNGSGKSTLLSCICGLMPYDGSVTWDGVSLEKLSVRERAAVIAVMQQSLRAPHITVEKLLSFGRQPYLGLSGMLGEQDFCAIDEAVRLASLSGLRTQYLDCISGGELRRAYLGMVLAQKTPLLLLDEATANMDMDYEASFLSLLRTLTCTEHRTVVSVMHNVNAAVQYADSVIVIDHGGVRFQGTPQALCGGTLMQELFRAVPIRAGERVFFDVRNS